MSLNPFKTQIVNGNYQEAQRIYEEFDFDNQSRANTWMREYISDTEDKYYSGQLDYHIAVSIVEEMQAYEAVYDDAVDAVKALNLDKQATDIFEIAKDHAEQGEWVSAVKQLESISVKYRLYDDVVALREECVSKYRDEVLEQMGESAEQQQIGMVQELRDTALQVLPDDKQIIETCQRYLDNYVQEILVEAARLAEQKDYPAAMQLLQHADGEYRNDKFMVAYAEYEYAAIVLHCEALATQKDYLGAVKYAQEQIVTYPQCNGLVSKYAELLVETTLETARGYAKNEQFEKAIDTIDAVVAAYYHTDLENELQQIRYDALVSRCETFVEQGDLLGAVQYAMEYAGSDSRSAVLLEKYTNLLIEETLATASEYAENRKYTQAISVIVDVQRVYNCSDLENAVEEYEQYIPRKLSECHVIDSEDAYFGITAQDCFGTTYENVIGFDESYSGEDFGYAIFNLDGKFINLSGCFVGTDELYKNMEVSCAIYADGKLLFESSRLGRTSKPVDINVDIKGTEQLRIEYKYYTWFTHDPFCIFDLTVS